MKMEFKVRNSKTMMTTPSVSTALVFVMIMIIFFLIGNREFYPFAHQYSVRKSVPQNSAGKDHKELDNTSADFERKSQKVVLQALDLIQFNSQRLSSIGKFNEIAKRETKTILKLNRTYESLLRLLETRNYIYCADIVGRKLQIPWTQNQRIRKEQFDNRFQETLQSIVLEIHKVFQIYIPVISVTSKYKINPRCVFTIALQV